MSKKLGHKTFFDFSEFTPYYFEVEQQSCVGALEILLTLFLSRLLLFAQVAGGLGHRQISPSPAHMPILAVSLQIVRLVSFSVI